MADQTENFEKLLTANLARAIDFTKFAEAKNAALLTFSSAWTALSINMLASVKDLTPGTILSFKIALPFFVAASLLAIWSFLPRRKTEIFHRDPVQARNLLYFGHIALFEPSAFSQRVKERYCPPDGTPIAQNYIDDLIFQVAINSQIADRKFTKFTYGVLLVLIGMTILGVTASASWILTLRGPDVAG